jgi:hypothetical protein
VVDAAALTRRHISPAAPPAPLPSHHHHHPCRAAPRIAAVVVLALASLLDPSSGHTLARAPAVVALMAASPRVARAARGVWVWGALTVFAAAALPAMKAAWVGEWAAVGNANFMLNQVLILTLAAGAVVAEFAAAALRVSRRGQGGGARLRGAAAGSGGRGSAGG